jgi:hypothetical protein
VVGRIMKVHAAPEGSPCMWTLAFGHHEDRTPTYGYEPTREAATAASRRIADTPTRSIRKPANRWVARLMTASCPATAV